MSLNKSKNLFIRTPLIESIPLSDFCDNKVYLKLENCQPSGSFKMRGISRLCQNAALNGYEEIISSSGGNAGTFCIIHFPAIGLAAACSARLLGLKCRIVVPKTTSKRMRLKIEKEGAEVEIYGEVWNDANEKALQIANESNKRICIHPFDDPILWSGHSTMIDEIAEEIDSTPSMIISCCGGGGLLCGLIEGMRRQGWTSVPLLAMETRGAESFNLAVKAGGVPVRLPGITSIATCLGSVIICDQLAHDYKKGAPPVLSHLVDDKEAVDACLKFADDHNLIVETACGAALAALYSGLVRKLFQQNSNNHPKGPIVVIVCGGAGNSISDLNKFKKQFDL